MADQVGSTVAVSQVVPTWPMLLAGTRIGTFIPTLIVLIPATNGAGMVVAESAREGGWRGIAIGADGLFPVEGIGGTHLPHSISIWGGAS